MVMYRKTTVQLIVLLGLLLSDCTTGTGKLSVFIETESIKDFAELANFPSELNSTIHQWYPYVLGLLHTETNYFPPETIRVYFSDKIERNIVAYTSDDGIIVANLPYFRRNPTDIGSLVHEMVHILQQYPCDACPNWLSEGIADYIRYYKFQYHQNNDMLNSSGLSIDNSLPLKPSMKQNITDGYEVTAYFLNYVVLNVRPDIIYWINESCREGRYNEKEFWMKFTGKTLRRLWRTMLKVDINAVNQNMKLVNRLISTEKI